MPTYEYACTACGQHVEVFQRLTDEALTSCEACGGALRKIFHPAGIVFKGSGFYATDSRSGSKSTSTTTPSTDTSSSGTETKGADATTTAAPAASSTAADSTTTKPAPATKAAK